MTDVAIILLVVYAMVGIGAALGTSSNRDSDGYAFLWFVFTFLLWPVGVGFMMTDKARGDED